MMVIPGFPIMMGGILKRPFLVASSQGATRSSSLSVAIPAGTKVSDLLILCVARQGPGDTTITAPSGWSTIFNDSAFSGQMAGAVFRKIATSGDISAGSVSVTGFNTGGSPVGFVGIIQAWRNAIALVSGTQSRTSTGNSVPSITVMSDGSAMAQFMLNAGSSGSTAPAQPDIPVSADLDRSVISSASAQPYNPRITSSYETELATGESGSRTWSSGSRGYLIQIGPSDN